ncbi:peroxiredoxin family protein [Candidatus Uabimicrobium sp. HlEnr_7]|uniref:peroxiredoxin family protein n=1 Tax=Candidatus Uabimicrobium helgolandensis TaxID=3095367 RepID=UPI0035571A56
MLHNKTYYIVICIFFAACSTPSVNQSVSPNNSNIDQGEIKNEKNKQVTETNLQKKNSQPSNENSEDNTSEETVWKENVQQEIKITETANKNGDNQTVIDKEIHETSMEKKGLETSIPMEKKDLETSTPMEKKDLGMSDDSAIAIGPKFNIAPITQQKFNLRNVFLSLGDIKGKKKSATLNLQKRFSSSKKQIATPNALVGNYLPVTRFLGSGGDVLDLADYQGKKIILVILRGFAGGICLACSAQTLALSKSVNKFDEKNAQIILVYPGRAESIPVFTSVLETLEEDYEAPFPIVLDVELELIKKLTIEGSLAKPTSMIVTTDGKIEYAYVGKGIVDRPTVSTLLAEIDTLSQK